MKKSGEDLELWERILYCILYTVFLSSVILGGLGLSLAVLGITAFVVNACTGSFFLALALISSGLALYLWENRGFGVALMISGIVLMVISIIALGMLKSC